MAGDLKIASSAIPSTAVGQFLTGSEAPIFNAPSTMSVKVHMTVTNTSATAVTVNISQVMNSGAAGALNRILVGSLSGALTSPSSTANPFPNTVERTFWLGSGDFLSGLASTNGVVSVVVDVVEFSSATTGAPVGIQTDAIGTGGSGTGTCTGTNVISTGNNRYLMAALLVQLTSGAASYTAYTSLTLTCAAGALTRLISVDFNNGSAIGGSVHLFGLASPTSGTNQTLTATVAGSGLAIATVLGSKSYSGVNSATSPTNAASTGPTSAVTLSLPITSGIGDVPVFAGAFGINPPQDFNLRTQYFNGLPSAFNIPQWLLFADAIGAATVTATTSNSLRLAAVGVDLKAA